jgi:UDP-GlcNAc:undecaprenyl-phosphate GlcNAc-1-phosphate transferase
VLPPGATWVVYAGIGAAVVTAVMPAVIRLLRRLGTFDLPNHRTSHAGAIPRGGGLALGLGLGLAIAVAALLRESVPVVPLAYVLCLLVLGLAEDTRGLSVRWRLVLQLACAGFVSSQLVASPGTEGAIVVVVVAVGLAGFVNAFNFMDGINGISACTAVVACSWYLVLGLWQGADELTLLAACLLGVSLGFLPWNFPHAYVFLGDSGSYALGAGLGVLALLAWTAGRTPIEAIAPLLIYLVDTSWTLMRRHQSGAPFAEAHREHVYQRLQDRLGQHWRVSVLVLACTVACVAIPLTVRSASIQVAMMIAVAALYVASPRWVGRGR